MAQRWNMLDVERGATFTAAAFTWRAWCPDEGMQLHRKPRVPSLVISRWDERSWIIGARDVTMRTYLKGSWKHEGLSKCWYLFPSTDRRHRGSFFRDIGEIKIEASNMTEWVFRALTARQTRKACALHPVNDAVTAWKWRETFRAGFCG